MRPAFSRSASANTTHALLPPSSRVTRFTVAAAFRAISIPTSVEPVKPTLPTSGCSTSASPTALPWPGEDVEHAGRQPRLEPELGVAQHGEGGEARRLEHHGVPGGDRRRGLPVPDVEREVPRRDQRRDADRLAEREHDPVPVDGDRRAEELVDRARVVAHHRRGVVRAPARVADRHPHVARLDQCELVRVLLDQVGPAVQHLRALDRRARAPVLERARGRANCAVGVLGPGLARPYGTPRRSRG